MLLLVAAVAVRGCHDIAMRVCVSRAGDDARVSLLSVRRRVQINERHIYIYCVGVAAARSRRDTLLPFRAVVTKR